MPKRPLHFWLPEETEEYVMFRGQLHPDLTSHIAYMPLSCAYLAARAQCWPFVVANLIALWPKANQRSHRATVKRISQKLEAPTAGQWQNLRGIKF